MNIEEALKQCPVFSTLNQAEFKKITSLAEEREYDAGTFIFREGNGADKLFVLKEGKVALQMTLQYEQTSRSVTVDIVTQNEVFGWSAVVEPYTYTLNAICLQKAKVLSLGGNGLRRLLDDNLNICCAIHKELVKVVASRLEDTRNILASERLVAVVKPD